MEFILFFDAKNQKIGGVNEVKDGLELPKNAIEFDRYYPRDENQNYIRKYRIGKQLHTVGDIHDIDVNFMEAFAYFAQNNGGQAYSIYLENKVPYFSVLDKDTTLVESREELEKSLADEILRDTTVEKSGKNK